MQKEDINRMIILSVIAIVDFHFTGYVLNTFLFGLFYYFSSDYFNIIEEEKEHPGKFDEEVEKYGYFKFYLLYLISAFIYITMLLFPISLLLAISQYLK